MKLLNLLFPPKCPFCGDITKEKNPVCRRCIEEIPFISGKVCLICGIPLEDYSYDICLGCSKSNRYFTKAFPVFTYEGSVSRAIKRFKYNHHPSFAYGFSVLMAQTILNTEEFLRGFDFITYVPQSRIEHFKKGYNQSYLLAKELSKLLKLPLKDTLKRKNTPRQATLKAPERVKNARRSYFPKVDEVSGTVLLVDDVLTTGATASYCAKLLRELGAERVYVAVLAARK
ncbi:MAG: double zinc ribbon domain-containing protein [Clostridia bacterium]|nr:double zinc ribbon domain-containing protein [Clostridia bacterium]